MIDSYGWATIVIRILSALTILSVIYLQIRKLKPPVKNQWIQYVMLWLALVMLSNYLLTLVLNFYRQPDGNLTQTARHFSQVYNAVAGLSSSILVNVLYRKPLDK